MRNKRIEELFWTFKYVSKPKPFISRAKLIKKKIFCLDCFICQSLDSPKRGLTGTWIGKFDMLAVVRSGSTWAHLG